MFYSDPEMNIHLEALNTHYMQCVFILVCSLVVDEEIPPYYVKRFECLEKRYINVTNY